MSRSHLDELRIRWECRECTWAVTGSAWSRRGPDAADRHESETGHKVVEEYEE